MSVTSIGTTGRVPVHVESYKDKFLRRFKEEPLVPIGMTSTHFPMDIYSNPGYFL